MNVNLIKNFLRFINDNRIVSLMRLLQKYDGKCIIENIEGF